MPRIVNAADDRFDLCNFCFDSYCFDEATIFEMFGDQGPYSPGDCLPICPDDDHPPYECGNFNCCLCGKLLGKSDNGWPE